jgi:hypothetical protein
MHRVSGQTLQQAARSPRGPTKPRSEIRFPGLFSGRMQEWVRRRVRACAPQAAFLHSLANRLCIGLGRRR